MKNANINNRKNYITWGISAMIDLHKCDPNLIREPEIIRKFTIGLCGIIDMKREGEPIIKRFGKGKMEGYSMMQFIFSSSITVHFDEINNRAFIDIFSCKAFDVQKAAEFCYHYFKAKDYKLLEILRK